jgi:hypothetical protein
VKSISSWTLDEVDQVLAGRARWPRHSRDEGWWERTDRILDRRLDLTGMRR